MIEDKISSEDKNKMRNKNTCNYLYFGRFADNPNSGRNFDTNKCFQVDTFSDLTDMINCGIATLEYNIDGNKKTYKTCFHIPDNKFPQDLSRIYKRMFVNNGLMEVFEVLDYLDTLDKKPSKEEKEELLKEIMELKKYGSLRKLQEIGEYVLTVEDKFGKKYIYTNEDDLPEVIEEGVQGNKSYSSNSPIVTTNNSKINLVNIGLISFVISLILF